MRQSALGSFFADHYALNDAIALELEQDFLVADCGLDRKDEDGMLRYVQQKYSMKRAITVPFAEHSASIMVRTGM